MRASTQTVQNNCWESLLNRIQYGNTSMVSSKEGLRCPACITGRFFADVFLYFLDRPDFDQRLDRTTFVHGSVGLRDAIQISRKIKDASRINVAF